jgi:hypothetical protein
MGYGLQLGPLITNWAYLKLRSQKEKVQKKKSINIGVFAFPSRLPFWNNRRYNDALFISFLYVS